MGGLITILVVPLIILNIFGGIVSGVWLAVLGEWSTIGKGLLMAVVGAFFCGTAIMPSMIFSFPGLKLYEKGGLLKVFAFPLMLIGLLWIFIVMGGWGLFSFKILLKDADQSSLLPMCIWAYGAAVGPWTYMASKENNEHSEFSVIFLQIASLIFAIMIAFDLGHPLIAILVFLGIMLLAFLLTIGSFLQLLLADARAKSLEL